MSFKIKQTQIEVNFGFFALLLLFVAAEKSKIYLTTLLFATIHEMVHLGFICKLSKPPVSVKLAAFGGEIKRASDFQTTFLNEALINLSAPLFNLFVGFLSKIITNRTTIDLSLISQVNLGLGFFNLLPYYNFDGGNALKNILQTRLEEEKSEKILTCLSLAVTIFFAFFTIKTFLSSQKNYTLAVVSAFMILSIVFKN